MRGGGYTDGVSLARRFVGSSCHSLQRQQLEQQQQQQQQQRERRGAAVLASLYTLVGGSVSIAAARRLQGALPDLCRRRRARVERRGL